MTIEFVNQSPRAYESLGTFQDDFDCFGLKLAALAGTASSTEVVLERRPFQTVVYQYIGIGMDFEGIKAVSCSGTLTFPATEGDRFQVTTVNGHSGCSATVSRSDASSPSGWSQLSVTKRQQAQPFSDSSGPWCKGDPAFKGSSILVVPRGS